MKQLLKNVKRLALALCLATPIVSWAATPQTYSDHVPSSEPVTVFTDVLLSELGTKYALGATFDGAWMQAGEAFPWTFSRTEDSLTVEFRRIDTASAQTYTKAIPVTFTQNGSDIQAVAGTPRFAESVYLSATLNNTQTKTDNDGNPVYRVSSLTLTPKTESINISFTYNNQRITDGSIISGIGQYAIEGTKWDTFGGYGTGGTGAFIGDNGGVYKLGLDGEKTAVEGASVKVENSSGSWYCTYNDGSAPNINGSKYFMWGYIDDNSNHLLPKVTVTGVPFSRYRVVTYFSTDTMGRKFGPITINGNISLMGNSEKTATTTGNDFWGGADWKGPLQEGKNYLVSPLLSGDELTIQGKANSSQSNGRAGISAISIVEALPVVINVEDGGTYELDLDAAIAEAGYVKFVCDGTFSLNGTESRTITASDISNYLDFTGVTGAVKLGSYTFYDLGEERVLPGGKIAFGKGSTVGMTETNEEYGKGIFTVSGLTEVSNVILSRIDGSSEEITVTDGVASRQGEVVVSGKACWIDYEMAFGDGKTGFENTGTSSLALQEDSSISGSNAFTDDGMLYTYAHPYRQGLTMPSTWTAVVRCTVPNYPDAAVITFGWNNNYIGLVAGETPKTEMRLVQYKSSYDHYVTNAVMTVQDATTAQHVYVFAVENNQTLKVYCDGSVILNKELDEPLTITSGFQVGSVLGGATGGIVRFAKNESPANTLSESVQKDARIDCVRLYDYSLSADQLAALSDEFPAVKLYEATVEADADTTWDALDWSNDWDGGNEYSKVLLSAEGNAAVVLPDSITAEELAFEVEPGSTLTLKGPGSLAVTRAINAVGFTLKFAGTITLATDTTFAGNFVFADDFVKAGNGAIKLANGATVGVDNPLVVTALGTYSCAEGTVVDASYDGDGVRFVPLSSAVAMVDDDYYTTLESALEAMGQDSTLTLLAPADRTIPLDVGQTLVAGEFTNVDVVIAEGVAEGYELVTEDGISTLVDNGTSTWTGEDESDINWNTPGNWSNGRVPKSYTVVTFNDGAKVSLNQDVSVAGVVVNDDVTIDGYACTLAVSGDVTGDGTLKLNSVRLANAANEVVTVAEAVAVEFSGESELGGENGVSLNGKVTISGKFSVTGSNNHAINGSVVIESGVTFSLSNSGSFTINGDAKVLGAYAFDVGSSVIVYMGKLTIVDGNVSIDGRKDGNLGPDATVVLAGEGAKLTDTRQITIDIEKVSSGLYAYDVVESNGVYSLSAWPKVTFTRPVANGSITVKADGLDLEPEASVAVGTFIIVTLTPNEDYKVDEASIMMGGVDLAADDYEGDDLIDFDEDTESGEIVVTIRVTSDIDMQFTFAPDVAEATFKVETPVGTRVEVWQSEQVEPNDDGSYTVDWGGGVTIKWFAADGYVLADEPVTKEYTAESLEVETVSVPENFNVVQAVAKVFNISYATLEDAIAAATSYGAEVVLQKNVTLTECMKPNPGASTTMTIDLNGYKITRTGTSDSDNGSAFDVQSGIVTITNGTIECMQDATCVYAITARPGSRVNLEDLVVTVNSEHGACVYAFANNYEVGVQIAMVYIKSGTYINTAKTGMSLDQANKTAEDNNNTGDTAMQMIFVSGGTFGHVDPELGDDSWSEGEGTFINGTAPAYSYIAVPNGNGTYTVREGTWVAKVGDTKFESCDDAFAAAKVSGAQVMILKDYPYGDYVTEFVLSEPVKVNANGYIIGTPKVTVAGGYIIAQEQSFLGADTWIVGTISGNAPNRIVEYGYGETRTLALDYKSGDGSVDVTTGDRVIVSGVVNSTNSYKVMEGEDVKFTAAPFNAEMKRIAAGYPKLKIGEGEATTLTAVDGVYTAKVTGGNAVISVEFEDIPTIQPIVPSDGGSATYDDDAAATSAAEAINADKETLITIPTALTDGQKATYYSYVEARATGSKVELAFTAAAEEVLQTAVDAEAEELAEAAVAAAASTDGGSVEVTATPGLYYVVEAGTEIGGIAPASCTLATDSKLELNIPNKGTKGFYKLRVSVTPVTVQQ